MVCYYSSLLYLMVYLHENWHCLKHICLCLIWYQEKHLTNKKSTSTSSLNCPTIMQLESWVCACPDTLRSRQNLWKPYTSDHSTFHLSTNSKTCFVLRHDSDKMMTLISWVLILIQYKYLTVAQDISKFTGKVVSPLKSGGNGLPWISNMQLLLSKIAT